MFDPSMKKKKKKKKAPMGEETVEEAPAAGENEDEDGADSSLVFDKKKKKKKKAPTFGNDDEGAAAEDEAPAAGLFEKKKKKKKKVREEEEPEPEEVDTAAAGEDHVRDPDEDSGDPSESSMEAPSSSAAAKHAAPDWADSDREYTYEEMLSRVFSFLKPSQQGSGSKFRMKPPQVFREGTKKVVLVNFPEICTSMNRSAEHVLAFMLAELGTSGSLDAASRVTFKGRFQPKHIESIVRQYLKEYVLCKLCKSPETKLTKDSNTRLFFMSCNVCGANRSVAPIKSGYQAQIGKRKKK